MAIAMGPTVKRLVPLLCLLLASPALAQDPVAGAWRVEGRNGGMVSFRALGGGHYSYERHTRPTLHVPVQVESGQATLSNGVLFTEAIGDNPDHGGGHDYTSWSGAGYGVIVRLNNGYEPAGTIPVSSKYPDFAKACARYVRNSKGCHIWIVGNAQHVKHFDGSRWVEQNLSENAALRAIWSDNNSLTAVGPSEKIFRFNGSQWSVAAVRSTYSARGRISRLSACCSIT